MTQRSKFIRVITETTQSFGRHNTSSYAAAIAYHAIISLAPLLLFSITVASLVYRREAAVTQLVTAVDRVAGASIAGLLSELIGELGQLRTNNLVLTLVALAVTIYAASNVFRQLVIALNAVWEVAHPSISIRDGMVRWAVVRLRRYVVGLLAAIVIIFSLLFSMIVSVFAGTLLDVVEQLAPGLAEPLAWAGLFALPLILVLLCLFAFKLLPSIDLAWRDIWPGALLTGLVLFLVEGAIGFYVSRNRVSSLYGVAGSVVVLMLWAYFSAFVVLAGAEFTRAYGRHFGTNRSQGGEDAESS